MNGNAVDIRLRFHLFLWYGLMLLGVLFLAFFLAASPFFVAFMVTGLAWLVLLPYHAQVSLFLALSTFSSALILPFIPGRPYFWEFAAVLAWSGVVITVWLRRYRPEFPRLFRENRALLVASFAYCIVLIITMLVRGFGLRVLGSGQVGGRLYIQQLLCAIFPLLMIMVRVDERTVVRLFTLQYLLAATYLLSDFVFAFTPAALEWLLYFLEIPNDALNFEIQSMRFGIRRFQSLSFFGQGSIYLVLMYYGLKDLISRRGLIVLPVTLAVFAVSLLSGHRWVIAIVGITVIFVAYAQRFYNLRNVLVSAGIAAVLLALTYGFANRMPQAFQRAVSNLPGIKLDYQARADAANTMYMRRVLFKIGLGLIPEYFWIGRGFTRFLDEYSTYWDPTVVTFHVNQGAFYNGFIGLMVNTGVFGTVAMLSFLFFGSRKAWQIIQHLRTYGCEDVFSRLCSVISGLWMANVLAFLFLHGDSEFAMRTFSLQAGAILLCHHLLRKRVESAAVA